MQTVDRSVASGLIAMAPDPKYVAAIREGLNGAYQLAAVEDLDPKTARIIVFSDHHKGAGDQADDFRRCEHAYTTALGFYLERGFRLFVLGDAEELWEENPESVLARYPAVFRLEAEFRARGSGFVRFWGNHDDLWADRDATKKHLFGPLGGDLTVHEALRLRVRRPDRDDATLFFVHGHQGTTDSDRLGGLARLPVRYLWRPFQRLTGYSATTPARDYALRAKHDQAMFAWAREQQPGLIMIAGHTHRPVFARSTPDPPPTRPIAELQAAVAAARDVGDEAGAAAARAELEYALTAARRPDEGVTVVPPCYFNTGCCSFPDGDITGLEIADGQIRLVRWPANLGEMRPHPHAAIQTDKRVLAAAPLDEVLDAVSRPVAAPGLEEHAVRPGSD